MKKSFFLYVMLFVIFFIVWGFAFLLFTGNGETKEEKEFGNKLVEVVKNNVENKEKVLDLNEVADFDWDKVYLFKPYTPNKYVEKVIGAELNYDSSIEYVDYCTLLVFMKDSKVVFQIDVRGIRGDFSTNENELLLKRDEAKFKIIKTKSEKSKYYNNYFVKFKVEGKSEIKNKNTRD